jgi:CRISPR locus-related DNA-binding protein
MPRGTLQIAPLGFYANERVRHVTVKRPADKVILIYTPENKDKMEEIMDSYRKDRIPVESLSVKAWKYNSILADILEVIIEHEKYDVEFNISCGTIAMRAACHMAAILADCPVHFVGEKEGDVVGDMETVQPLSYSQLTSPKKNILKKLVEVGGKVESQRELGSRAGLRASSISRHVKDLLKYGYVTKTIENGKHTIQVTDLGRVIIRLKKVKAQRKK